MLDARDIALARQPIFDRTDRLVAYELLYRDGPLENRVVAGTGACSTRMSSVTIANAFIGLGIGRVTGGRRAFINVDRTMLLDGSLAMLDPQQVVLELLESVTCDAEIEAACADLVGRGYCLALDDFAYCPSFDPLLRLAGIVKVDVLGRADDELRGVLAQVRPFGVTCLAERVETAADHARCAALGFELFQGYFYARPEMLAGRDVPVQQGNLMRLLNLLRDPDASQAHVEAVFRGDVRLTYKLLRIVNSAGTGCSGVSSIEHALRLLGRTALHRWLALLLVASFTNANGVRGALVTAALTRARLGELLAAALGRRDGGALFMTGLFSLLDALMRVPMQEVVQRLDLTPELCAVLLAGEGPYAQVLGLIEAYEAGRWDAVRVDAAGLRLAPHTLPALYAEALEWAHAQVDLAAAA
jgi:c-di-GMP phosphodiesterase